MMKTISKSFVISFLLVLGMSRLGWAAPRLNFEFKPISYSSTEASNEISELQKKLDSKNKTLRFDENFGYLPALLQELKIPVSSQMLIFSKTSQQKLLIAPDQPRAIYFNDEIYIGFVRGGFIEIMVSDTNLGIAFYTLGQEAELCRLQKQNSKCMTCHSTNHTKNVPGLQVRSHLVDPDGHPIFSAGNPRTDHSSPLSERWGGWYVTGTHGATSHLGNLYLPTSKRPEKSIKNMAGNNVTNLNWLINTEPYLSSHSDIVALMVFEHQVDAHNYMTRTNYAWRIDSHRGDAQKAEANWKQEAETLLEHLLFVGEAKLEFPIEGTSGYAKEFSQRGPFNSQGVSLRQFDLRKRLFKFPCSYMIHSKMFRLLAQPVRDYIYHRMYDVLNAKNVDQKFKHLSKEDRKNLRQLLPELLPDLKNAWE